MMRKLLYIFIILQLISCDDFLDVNPKSIIVNDDLFTNDEGFQDALYGVYASLNDLDLYGKSISFELTGLCAQNFKSDAGSPKQNAFSNLDFDNPLVKLATKNVWNKMYEVIGYVNNIIKNTEELDAENIEYYNLYKGEALGLRAALHFDLLRMFAVDIDSPDNDRKSRAIPYVTIYSNSITKFSSLSKVYENIINDLKEAEALLKDDESYMTYPRYAKGDSFLDARITHLNLYAVQALLARVYWQKKDMENAAIYAKKVIDSKKFHFMDKTSLLNELKSFMSLNETIWGLYDEKFFISARHFYFYENRLFPRNDYQQFYTVDSKYGKDYRIDWFSIDEDDYPYLSKLYNAGFEEDENYITNAESFLGINMIRIPEMYYIMAEWLLDTDNDKAIEYFDAVIEARGMVGLADRGENIILTKEMIINERKREFIGEGQEWFRMKRENEDIDLIVSGGTVTGSDNAYTWPYPEIEDEMNSNLNTNK